MTEATRPGEDSFILQPVILVRVVNDEEATEVHIEGVLEVLGLDRRSVEALDLMLAYGYGKRRGTYPE